MAFNRTTNTDAASVPRISAVVCSSPDRDVRVETLAALREQSLPSGDYEILVAGRCPAPPASLEGTWRTPPDIVFLESVNDLTDCAARDAALAAARAPLVAFLPADAIADFARRAQLCRAFDQFGNGIEAIGGRVRGLWEEPRPHWLPDELLNDLPITRLGDETRLLRPEERLCGANIAFRRSSILDRGGFIALKKAIPPPYQESSTLETGFSEWIRSDGGRLGYSPLAVVDQPIPAAHLTPEWFRRRAAWRAVADAFGPERRAPEKRWLAVKEFLATCPPENRTLRGLMVIPDNPAHFGRQVAAIYDSVACLLAGISENDDD
ncbi:MAG: hypothetical protein F8N15_04425 [Methanobacterium sp.]|nr:hypothetical protein [Methanobacterium sp.]